MLDFSDSSDFGAVADVDSDYIGASPTYDTVAPDASGGLGSISSAFASIALNGLSKGVDGYTSKKFPLGFYAQQYDVSSDGTVVPRAAVTQGMFGAQFGAALKSPVALYAGVAVIVVLGIILIAKKH
jgi:hypothetical protein